MIKKSQKLNFTAQKTAKIAARPSQRWFMKAANAATVSKYERPQSPLESQQGGKCVSPNELILVSDYSGERMQPTQLWFQYESPQSHWNHSKAANERVPMS
ncbi:hypothetical protein [Hafnia alvei]|uniref:hypothetical protein n=1 Tax=Hafnia alvei TaxID=569 RepID=UPI000930871E|nr:hypothetical protein [Hafnia alvei]NLS55910.1 hypothetical protein [Hafnia alvei]